jgi:hypothetical protein
LGVCRLEIDLFESAFGTLFILCVWDCSTLIFQYIGSPAEYHTGLTYCQLNAISDSSERMESDSADHGRRGLRERHASGLSYFVSSSEQPAAMSELDPNH